MDGFSKYYGLKWFIINYLKQLGGFIPGGIAYCRLLKKNKDTHYIILHRTLGDSIWALAYLSEYKRQKGIRHVTVVCVPYIRQLCGFYSKSVDDLIMMDWYKIGSMQVFARSFLGRYLISFPHRERITFTQPYCNLPLRAFNYNPELQLPDCMKRIVYQINANSLPEFPGMPDMDLTETIEKYGLKRGRTVYFNQEANSIRLDISGLCAKLAEYCKANGYRVLTLTRNDQQAPVKGTKALPCSLAEAYRLAEYGGTVIGLRSGFLDFMVFADCKIISIGDSSCGVEELGTIDKLGVNDDCHEILYRDDETTFQEIVNLLHAG